MPKKKTLASKDSKTSEKSNSTQVKRATTSAVNNEKKSHAVHFSLDDVASIVAQKKASEPKKESKKTVSKKGIG